MTDEWGNEWYEGEDNDETFDSSDQGDIDEVSRKAEAREQATLNVTQMILKDYEGRRWMWEKMKACHVFGNPVILGDTHATYFNLGMANIGKMMLMEVMNFSDLYMKMAEEARERETHGV